MATEKYVIAIDQGTTGSTVLVLDKQLRVLGRANKEFRQIFPKPGWVEHALDDIWDSVGKAMEGALAQAKISPDQIGAIGITNQRETTALWDRSSGRPLHHAIVWQDRRTTARCAELKEQGLEPLFKAKTGLVLDPYFSGTKLAWLLDNVDGARARAEKGELAFGTIDTYLVWRLTAGVAHVTDVSNASRTLLMGLESRAWEPELLELLQIPEALLPEIRPSAQVYGTTKGLGLIPDGVPVAGIAGDQQAALFGQACFEAGEAKCTYGTGAFLLMNTGATPKVSNNGLLTTVAWEVGGEVRYALEGSAFIAGAAVQWLRDGLGLFEQSADIEALAASVPDSGGVVFVPALAGLGAPHWRPEARGVITGLDRGVTKAHIARATLEGVAFQIYDLIEAMGRDAGSALPSLKVDGGAAANNLLMDFQAGLLGVDVVRPKMLETTALGAAFLAGLATEIWQDRSEIQAAWQADQVFTPQLDEEIRAAHLARWARAVEAA